MRVTNLCFCLADVCKVVGLTNPSSVKQRLDNEDVQVIDLHALKQNEGAITGNSMANFITESGFYDVLLYSDAPQVKPFRKWVNKRSFALNPQAWCIHDARDT